jgi:predicted DNA binding protein
MVTIAELSVPTEAFALAETLPEFPEVVVVADQIVSHAPGATLPCLWATDGDVPAFESRMAADRTVNEITAKATVADEHLYYFDWAAPIKEMIAELIDHEAVFLQAAGRGDRWRFRLRFLTRDQFDQFRSYYADEGPSFRLEQLFTATHPRQTHGDATAAQQEALRTAFEHGYFQVPRQASLEDIATALDISAQAVSERLRRGIATLVQEMIVTESHGEPL